MKQHTKRPNLQNLGKGPLIGEMPTLFMFCEIMYRTMEHVLTRVPYDTYSHIVSFVKTRSKLLYKCCCTEDFVELS